MGFHFSTVNWVYLLLYFDKVHCRLFQGFIVYRLAWTVFITGNGFIEFLFMMDVRVQVCPSVLMDSFPVPVLISEHLYTLDLNLFTEQ